MMVYGHSDHYEEHIEGEQNLFAEEGPRSDDPI
jgi:hypothetical protein